MTKEQTKARTTIRIGTRGSLLALNQTEIVKKLILKNFPHLKTKIIKIKTTGDKLKQAYLSSIGGKGLFTKEIEEALIARNIDIAVHSMKDMPAFLPDKLEVPAIIKRENPSDAFISIKYKELQSVPEGASIGTSSIRRSSQLLYKRPDLKIIPFRGNVSTRLKKLEQGVADGTFLAVAGLKRLKMTDKITQIIDHDTLLPAVAQGAIGIECRKNDEFILTILTKINHNNSYIIVKTERAFLKQFKGSCTTPIAALAEIKKDKIYFSALIAKPDGSKIIRLNNEGNLIDAEEIGIQTAKELKRLGGKNFFTLPR